MSNSQTENVRAVVFDFDGTLAETNIDFGEMRRRTVEHIRAWGLWEDGEDERRWVLELIAHTAAKLDGDRTRAARYRQEAMQILEDVEMLTCGGARPFPGIQDMLTALRDRGISLGVVTRNCRRGVQAVTERHQLLYDVLLTRDDVERVKPDPAHLLEALCRLSVAPDVALMVGDHITDIQVGRAAGTLTCGVLTAKTTEQEFEAGGADFVLDSAADLAGVLCVVGAR